ncbi:hypothetical protein FJY93_01375 [Candidatus Kaiserbacteria bacterium]|nr:hypothetical protein [Candidatus Kaiserbacteria bacterium]
MKWRLKMSVVIHVGFQPLTYEEMQRLEPGQVIDAYVDTESYENHHSVKKIPLEITILEVLNDADDGGMRIRFSYPGCSVPEGRECTALYRRIFSNGAHVKSPGMLARCASFFVS